MPAKKAPKPPKKAVIGDLHQLQCRYVICCMDCGYKRVFTPSEAVEAFGWNLKLIDLRYRIKCSSCGAPCERIQMMLHPKDRLEMLKREGLEAHGPEDVKTRSPGGVGKYPQRNRHNRMSLQGDLRQMKECGTFLYSTCTVCKKHHEHLDLDQLIGLYGPETDLWDRWSECPTPGCTGKAFFIASPGRGTPTRPLLTSVKLDPYEGDALDVEGAIRRKAS